MVTRKCLNVTLYIHCLSCLILPWNNSRLLYPKFKIIKCCKYYMISKFHVWQVTCGCAIYYKYPNLITSLKPSVIWCVVSQNYNHWCCSNNLEFNSESNCSNRGWDTGYLRSSWFSSAQVVQSTTFIRPRPLPSTFFPIHFSPIILPPTLLV